MKTLLIGGARSGKSSLAARWADERSRDVCCIVTASASDAEMEARITAHRRERPPHWRVREEPLRLGAAITEESRTGDLLLVDCLTLWTANCLWPPGRLCVEPQPDLQADLTGWHTQRDAFLESLRNASHTGDFPRLPSEIIIVSNEVGTGLVPENAAARLFRDEQGRLNQLVAAACDAVFLVTAGLALCLK
jgi:adenosylcobinamide kinase / adenosylcobinamide-phosphate guanylyltransferase